MSGIEFFLLEGGLESKFEHYGPCNF
jgi:hypothetical protein